MPSLVHKGFAQVLLSVFLVFASIQNASAESHSTIPFEVKGRDLREKTGAPILIRLNETKLGTVIIFVSAVCPCSDSHIPALNKIYRDFQPLGFQFVGVHSNANETVSDSVQYFSKKFKEINSTEEGKILFPVIQDDGAKIADQFKAFKTPHVYIVSANNQIVFQGGVDDSRVFKNAKYHYLRDALTAIAEGKAPSKSDVRVLGCEIRRP